jgi:hypothetical protein
MEFLFPKNGKRGMAIVIPFSIELEPEKEYPLSIFPLSLFIQSKKLPLRPFKENSFELSALRYQRYGN